MELYDGSLVLSDFSLGLRNSGRSFKSMMPGSPAIEFHCDSKTVKLIWLTRKRIWKLNFFLFLGSSLMSFHFCAPAARDVINQVLGNSETHQ